MLLKHKTAVITGCNKGIGMSILKTFSENGANIIACVRKISKEFKDEVEELKKNHKNEITIEKLDFSDEGASKEIGTKINLSDTNLEVVSVGPVANENFKNLGHLVLKLDSSNEEAQLGDVRCTFDNKPNIKIGDTLRINN